MADTLLAIDRHRRGRWKETGNRAGRRQTPSSFRLGQSNTALMLAKPGVRTTAAAAERTVGRVWRAKVNTVWGQRRDSEGTGSRGRRSDRERRRSAGERAATWGGSRSLCALLTLLPSTAPASTTRPLSPTLPCPSLLTASRMVDNSARRRSVDVGGLALALSDEGRGHGWGGWEETDSGETRFVTCSDARSPLQSPFHSTGMRST